MQECAQLVTRLGAMQRFDVCAHGRPTLAPLIDPPLFCTARAAPL